MKKSEFIEQLKNMSNYTYIPELPEYAEGVEMGARQIINNIDRNYRHNISTELKGDSTIIHVRENDYNGRKVIQFQARTARM